MRVTAFVILVIFLVSPAWIFSAEVDDNRHTKENSIMVSGMRYQPINAKYAAQASLMARMATVLDTYRKALASSAAGSSNEKTFYLGVSCFVKRHVVEKEEYLEGGRIEIIEPVPLMHARPSLKAVPDNLTSRVVGPHRYQETKGIHCSSGQGNDRNAVSS